MSSRYEGYSHVEQYVNIFHIILVICHVNNVFVDDNLRFIIKLIIEIPVALKPATHVHVHEWYKVLFALNLAYYFCVLNKHHYNELDSDE